MVRLYVGGLPPSISAQDVVERFVPFGEVTCCDLVSAQQGGKNIGCRGFAYVDLSPKDDAALARCLSLYNHCKWKGGILRVEPAKADYHRRLQDEWDKDAAFAAAKATECSVVQDIPVFNASVPLQLPSRVAFKTVQVTVADGLHQRVKRIPPTARALPVSSLSWDPLPEPLSCSRRRRLDWMRSTASDAHAPQQHQQQQQPQQQQQQQVSSVQLEPADGRRIAPSAAAPTVALPSVPADKPTATNAVAAVKQPVSKPAASKAVSLERHQQLKLLQVIDKVSTRALAVAPLVEPLARPAAAAQQQPGVVDMEEFGEMATRLASTTHTDLSRFDSDGSDDDAPGVPCTRAPSAAAAALGTAVGSIKQAQVQDDERAGRAGGEVSVAQRGSSRLTEPESSDQEAPASSPLSDEEGDVEDESRDASTDSRTSSDRQEEDQQAAGISDVASDEVGAEQRRGSGAGDAAPAGPPAPAAATTSPRPEQRHLHAVAAAANEATAPAVPELAGTSRPPPPSAPDECGTSNGRHSAAQAIKQRRQAASGMVHADAAGGSSTQPTSAAVCWMLQDHAPQGLSHAHLFCCNKTLEEQQAMWNAQREVLAADYKRKRKMALKQTGAAGRGRSVKRMRQGAGRSSN